MSLDSVIEELWAFRGTILPCEKQGNVISYISMLCVLLG
jgi:hypothetical protein